MLLISALNMFAASFLASHAGIPCQKVNIHSKQLKKIKHTSDRGENSNCPNDFTNELRTRV
jgi:hypothetical protein